MSNAGKNLNKTKATKVRHESYLMAPEVQEAQMRVYFVLFNRIPHAFCVLSI